MARSISSASRTTSPKASRAPKARATAPRARTPRAGGKKTAAKPSAHSGGAIPTVKKKAIGIGESVVAWGKAHPVQAALAAAAVVAGVAALISLARHRRASTAHGHEASSDGVAAFRVEDLLTSQVATPPVPENSHGPSSTDAIAPSRERTTPSHRFRPIRTA